MANPELASVTYEVIGVVRSPQPLYVAITRSCFALPKDEAGRRRWNRCAI